MPEQNRGDGNKHQESAENFETYQEDLSPENRPIEKPQTDFNSDFSEVFNDAETKLSNPEQKTPENSPDIEQIRIDIDETKPEFEKHADEFAEEVLSEKDQLLKLIDEEFAEEFEKIRFDAEPDNAEEIISKMREDILEKIQGPTAKTQIGKALKFVGSRFGVPAIAGAGIRSIAKNSARAYLGLSSFGASIGLGAVFGGGWSALESYRKDRLRIDSDSLLNQLDEVAELNDNVKAAHLIDKARKQLKSGKVSPLEASTLKLKLQRAELDLRWRLDSEKNAELTETEKFLKVMEASRSSRKDLRKLEGIKNEKLEEAVNLEMKKNPEFRKTFLKKTLIGAISGAFGGAVGYGVHELIDSEYVRGLFGGGKAADHVVQKTLDNSHSVQPIPQPGPTPTPNFEVNATGEESLVTAAELHQQEVINSQASELMQNAQSELMEAKFTVAADNGEGATHAARDLIHDYLINKEHINGTAHTELTEEQLAKLIYAEDVLKNEFLGQTSGAEHIVKKGQEFVLTGGQIEEVWAKAEQLSPEQIASITKMLQSPDHHLSEETLKFLQQDSLHNASNEAWGKILENAKDTAKSGVDNESTNLGLHATITAEETKSTTMDAVNKYLLYGALTALAAGGVYAGYKVTDFLAGKFKDSWDRQEREENGDDSDFEGDVNKATPYWEESMNAQSETGADAEVEANTENEPSGIEITPFAEMEKELIEKYDLQINCAESVQKEAVEHLAVIYALVKEHPDFFKNKVVNIWQVAHNKIDDTFITVGLNQVSAEQLKQWLEEDINGSQTVDAEQPVAEENSTAAENPIEIEEGDLDELVNEEKQNFKENFGLEIKFKEENKEKILDYMLALERVAKQFPDYFSKKTVNFNTENESRLIDSQIHVNMESMTTVDFEKWLRDYAKAESGSNKFTEKMKSVYGVEVIVNERHTKNAKKFYPFIEAAVKKNPAFFQKKPILISYLDTKEEADRIVINSVDTIDNVEKFLGFISKDVVEVSDIDWGSALGANEEQEQEKKKTPEPKKEVEPVELSYSSPEEIKKEGKEKGLTPRLQNTWFDLMRDEGGFFSENKNGSNPLEKEEIEKIRDGLRSVQNYKNLNPGMIRQNVEKTREAYAIILKAFDETREQDKANQHQFIKTLLSNIKALNKDLFNAVEDSVLKHNYGKDHKEFGLNPRG